MLKCFLSNSDVNRIRVVLVNYISGTSFLLLYSWRGKAQLPLITTLMICTFSFKALVVFLRTQLKLKAKRTPNSRIVLL